MELRERQLCLMKLMLVLMRDRRARQGQVRSVGYIREYGEMPDEMGVYTLGQLTDEQMATLAEEIGVKKRPAAGKSDIYMNDLGYALQWSKQSVVLMDQVDVQDLAGLARQLQLSESMIDEAVAQHQSVDTPVCTVVDTGSTYHIRRKDWEKLLAYMLCQGTTQEASKFPADYVLSFEDALNMNTWVIYEPKRYVELMWEHIHFAMNAEQKLSVTINR